LTLSTIISEHNNAAVEEHTNSFMENDNRQGSTLKNEY